MKRIVITSGFILFFSCLVNAQEYKTALGIRAGNSSGLSIKHFMNHKAAFEGLLTTRWEGLDITGLYEMHNEAFDVKHLNWYYGGGGHLGFYNGSNVWWGRAGAGYLVIGIDGILGIEYTFPELPVNLGIDWKPAINFVGYSGFWSEGAISARYVF
jgi:hypothetical protein